MTVRKQRRIGRTVGLAGAWLRKSAVDTLELLFPLRCVCCSTDLGAMAGEILMCESCRNKLAPFAHYCLRCGSSLPPAFTTLRGCWRCKHRRLYYAGVTHLGKYDDDLRRAVLQAKNAQREMLAVAMTELLWQKRADDLSSFQPEVVVPVPMFWARRLFRGANSAEVIAQRLALRLQTPACHMLRRRCNTLPQSGLAPPARFENVRGAFRLRRRFQCRDARVLLVDDILTTGATCNEAAKILCQQGAAKVSVAVLARAEGPD